MKHIFLPFLFLLFTTALFAQNKDSVYLKQTNSKVIFTGASIGNALVHPATLKGEKNIGNISFRFSGFLGTQFTKKISASFGFTFDNLQYISFYYSSIPITKKYSLQIMSLNANVCYSYFLNKRIILNGGLGLNYNNFWSYSVHKFSENPIYDSGIDRLRTRDFISSTLCVRCSYKIKNSAYLFINIGKTIGVTSFDSPDGYDKIYLQFIHADLGYYFYL